jgi:hypothetical protein
LHTPPVLDGVPLIGAKKVSPVLALAAGLLSTSPHHTISSHVKEYIAQE